MIGVIYFGVIFVANLVTVLMFIVSNLPILVINSANGIRNYVQFATVSRYSITQRINLSLR